MYRKANAITSAMGGGWQVQQKIFSVERRKIHSLWPLQFGMHCKCRYFDFVDKFFQPRHATQFHRLRKGPICPERSGLNADVDVVVKRASATNSLRIQFRNRAFFLAFEM